MSRLSLSRAPWHPLDVWYGDCYRKVGSRADPYLSEKERPGLREGKYILMRCVHPHEIQEPRCEPHLIRSCVEVRLFDAS